MSFLAEGNKLVEEMPAETRCRVSRAGSAEGEPATSPEGDALIWFHKC